MKEEKQDDRPKDDDDNDNVYDPLAPFLPSGKILNKEQAEQAKEDCLRALKERLVERLNIITVFIFYLFLLCLFLLFGMTEL